MLYTAAKLNPENLYSEISLSSSSARKSNSYYINFSNVSASTAFRSLTLSDVLLNSIQL